MPDDPGDKRKPRSPPLGIPLGQPGGDPGRALEALGRAARDTQQTANTTLDRVGTLRQELTGRIEAIDSKVDQLAVSSARVEGQVGILVEEMRATRQVRVSAAVASVELEKTGEIVKVQEAAAVRSDRRQFWLKVAAGVGPVLAALATLLASRC